ncbi:octanoyltransferase LipM [Geobacter sp. OR-1]|uniref:lipoate--protein ligase family protein n=1 Tax=Geobacter sp. OR-1 TaxID=1266765 RepID=UPI00054243E6|nr:lipoate--protein ligase family protein [Geobacter sp. OR-1]GAM09147.1 octanoyltransferase LipM [Geobacter sp. OR-1]
MNTVWRLIDTGPLSGPENMAIDEALLACFDPENSAPVLRFYGWNPPALSLGRFQDSAAVLDLNRCMADGVPVVRRITGGGVIYHADELTYSIVCAPRHIPHAATVKESFRILTAFLLRFYQGLGLNARYVVDAAPDLSRLGERTPFCFAGRESFDIMLDGRKIGGNAQRRLKGVVFQHGSIPLRNRVATGIAYLREPPAGLDVAVAALADFGVGSCVDDLKERLKDAFEEAISSCLQPDVLFTAEKSMADRLGVKKYLTSSWNIGGEEVVSQS